MNKTHAAYVLARNTDDGRIEFWTGYGWSAEYPDAEKYRTLQAADKAGVKATAKSNRPVYVSE